MTAEDDLMSEGPQVRKEAQLEEAQHTLLNVTVAVTVALSLTLLSCRRPLIVGCRHDELNPWGDHLKLPQT